MNRAEGYRLLKLLLKEDIFRKYIESKFSNEIFVSNKQKLKNNEWVSDKIVLSHLGRQLRPRK